MTSNIYWLCCCPELVSMKNFHKAFGSGRFDDEWPLQHFFVQLDVLLGRHRVGKGPGALFHDTPDLVLSDFSGPDGWTYSSRILEEELHLDTPEVATVLAIRSATTSTWEMREK